MALEQPAVNPTDIREAWISDRMEEFANDPRQRDRALASILYDSLMLSQNLGEMVGKVREVGIGGIMKEMLRGK